MRIVAIDLGGTAVKLGVFESGRLVGGDEFATVDGQIGLDEVAGRSGSLLDGALPTRSGSRCPGSSTRRVRACWRRTASTPSCTTSTSRPGPLPVRRAAVVENDARAALIGEIADGSARGSRDAVLIVLGTGIGAAAVVEGRIVRGRHGHGGILGGTSPSISTGRGARAATSAAPRRSRARGRSDGCRGRPPRSWSRTRGTTGRGREPSASEISSRPAAKRSRRPYWTFTSAPGPRSS